MLLWPFVHEKWRQKKMKNYILTSYQDSWHELEGVLSIRVEEISEQTSTPVLPGCPSTVNGKCHCHSTHRARVCCTHSDLTTHSQKNGAGEIIFLSESYFLTGRSLLMTWNTVQPSQVSTMLSTVLLFFYYNIDSVLLWKDLYALAKSHIEAVGT